MDSERKLDGIIICRGLMLDGLGLLAVSGCTAEVLGFRVFSVRGIGLMVGAQTKIAIVLSKIPCIFLV